MKYLLVALVLFVAFHIWRSNRRQAAHKDKPAAGKRAPEDMVVCAHCGVHLPYSDAVTKANHEVYCSLEHQRLGPR